MTPQETLDRIEALATATGSEIVESIGLAIGAAADQLNREIIADADPNLSNVLDRRPGHTGLANTLLFLSAAQYVLLSQVTNTVGEMRDAAEN